MIISTCVQTLGTGVAVGVAVGTMGVGSGKIVIGAVGPIGGVGVGVTNADAVALVVALAVVVVVDTALDAVCDALLAAWLLLVDDVQPATKIDETIISTMTAINFDIINLAFTMNT
jgi:hypothetical protein